MCAEIKLPSGKYVENIGELKKEFFNLVFDKIYSKNNDKFCPKDSDCLCCLDLEATAKANNLKCKLLQTGDVKFLYN